MNSSLTWLTEVLCPLLASSISYTNMLQTDPTLVDIHIHTSAGPLRAHSDPHTGFICINQSMLTRVLALNPSIAAHQYWHVIQAKHPSGSLTCFGAKHHHLSVLDFYKPNDQIWINKGVFKRDTSTDLHSRSSNTIIAKTSLYTKVAFLVLM